MASIVAFIAGLGDLLTSGAVVGTVAEFLLQFMGQPESYKPYLTDRVYQFLVTFAPIIIIILRNTNLKYKPPIQKITKE